MTSPVTGETITDEQIRVEWGTGLARFSVDTMLTALGMPTCETPFGPSRRAVQAARARCAAAWNARQGGL